MARESVNGESTGANVLEVDGTRRSSDNQNSESEGCRLWPLFVRCVVNGNGELIMRCRLAKDDPALSGEEVWSIRCDRLCDFANELDDAGVATTFQSIVDKDDDWIPGNGLAVTVVSPLTRGVP